MSHLKANYSYNGCMSFIAVAICQKEKKYLYCLPCTCCYTPFQKSKGPIHLKYILSKELLTGLQSV